MITLEQFAKSIPCSTDIAATWHPLIENAMQNWGINTLDRVAGFLANMSQESGKFTQFEENLNYSAQGLANTWPSRYALDKNKKPRLPNHLAITLHRDRGAIANHTYANRTGNGDKTSGDGWRFRGRGPKQITGKDNYRACGNALGLDLINNPDLLLVPVNGANAAGWYWATHNCNELMDIGDFKGACIAINGGLIGYEDGNNIGLDDRVELWVHTKSVLCL